jgi:hypothetical protein
MGKSRKPLFFKRFRDFLAKDAYFDRDAHPVIEGGVVLLEGRTCFLCSRVLPLRPYCDGGVWLENSSGDSELA